MCKFIYHEEGNNIDDTPCQLQNYFSLNKENEILPLDNLGYCIFHSENIEWKQKNNFSYFSSKLFEIVKCIDKGTIFLEDLNGSFDLDFRGIKWTDCTILDNDESAIFIKDISLSNSKSVYLMMHKSCFYNDLVISNVDAANLILDFRNCTFKGGVSFQSTKLKEVSFHNGNLNGGIYITDCEVLEYSEFRNMNVQAGFIIGTSTFYGETIFCNSKFDALYIDLKNVNFKDVVDFSRCIFIPSINIENCEFANELFISDAVFKNEVRIHSNKYGGNVYFVSNNPDNKIFENIIYLKVEEENLNGLITFENVNFLNIAQQDRENLLKLEKSNKVKIGKGCIKYRVQSPIITIKSSLINQNIITELTTSFSNYFLYSEGFNLGVEFVNKQINNLQLFYYTDELISNEEFIERLKLAEREYWDFTISKNETDKSKKIQTVDNYSSKLSVLLKIAVRKQFGLWSDTETTELLKSISYNEYSISSDQINCMIENLIININPQNMEIKELNVSHGGQVNIAERIGKIEFNPKFQNISERDFNSLKGLLSKLDDLDFNDLRQNTESIKTDDTNSSKLNLLKEKAVNLFNKHGIPISHSLTASGIFEFLKSFFF